MATTEDKVSRGGEPPSQPPAKTRSYQRPELRRLGSVAELTMTGGNTTADFPGQFKTGA